MPISEPMKLITIMSVAEYADVLEKLYEDHHVPVYSDLAIEGHRHDDHAAQTNWFGRSPTPVYSRLSFAFVPAAKADEMMEAIAAYNREHPDRNPLRAFQMNVEKSI